jgi:uncharacterized protein YaaN involved in tellurite resistance
MCLLPVLEQIGSQLKKASPKQPDRLMQILQEQDAKIAELVAEIQQKQKDAESSIATLVAEKKDLEAQVQTLEQNAADHQNKMNALIRYILAEQKHNRIAETAQIWPSPGGTTQMTRMYQRPPTSYNERWENAQRRAELRQAGYDWMTCVQPLSYSPE